MEATPLDLTVGTSRPSIPVHQAAPAQALYPPGMQELMKVLFNASLAEINFYYSMGLLQAPAVFPPQPQPQIKPEEADYQLPVPNMGSNHSKRVHSPVNSHKPAHLPPRKRLRSSGSSDGSSQCSPSVVFVQDETINNFAQENRKRNLITISRKCLLDGCMCLFKDKAAMFEHMLKVHNVRQFRCLVRDCGESYDTQQLLTAHLKAVHAKANPFQCTTCDKKFHKYELMTHHIYSEHASGQFRCAAEGCNFSGTIRAQVSRHFETSHRAYECPFANCDRTFTYTGHLRTHERTHLQIKPFGCLWPDCGYISENKSHVLAHVRNKHFKIPSTKKAQAEKGIVDQRNANDFLHIDVDLLNHANEEVEKMRRQHKANSTQTVIKSEID